MTYVDLYQALYDLAPPLDVVQHFVGEADADAVAPWLVLNVETADSIHNFAGGHLGGTLRLRVTCVADEVYRCHWLVDQADRAFRGARVVVPGWATGILSRTQQSGPYKAGLTATDTNLRYQVAQLWYSLTASATG